MQLYDMPDERGHFGQFGGSFVAETLVEALEELRVMYDKYRHDPEFLAEYAYDLKHFVGRPSPIYHAERLSDQIGGAQIYLKREDLNHTGAHKVNNTIGQALLAKRMGKPRVIAETGAGQHGVATATIAARLGLECVVYMGAEDVKRQAPNVFRMKLLGATVVPVESGSKTLKDALNEAMRDWVTNVADTFYIIGTVAGPHPYPMMVRDFQTVIGMEAKEQMQEMVGRQPDAVVACVGGGSNAMGIFHPYIDVANVRLIGVEAAGHGMETGQHAAPLTADKGSAVGVLHGNRTYLMQDADGNIIETHSVSAGMDYPGVGPEHAWLKDIERAEYVGITDDEAMAAFHNLCRTEGIIPALESSHALAHAEKMAKTMNKDEIILVNLSYLIRALTMSRIQATFAALKANNKKALIPYITAGDPHPKFTVELMHTMAENGADIIELGVPFSDPMADGPVIQRASERALEHKVGLRKVLSLVKEFRATDDSTPVVLMGYANPIEAMGFSAFTKAAKEAGVDGVLTVDYPPEECGNFIAELNKNDMDSIFLLSPTTEAERIDLVVKQASGFLYYVSLKGVTGAANLDVKEVKERVAGIRTKTDLPVGVGFGVKDAATAKAVAAFADAVVVGSRTVLTIEAATEATLINDITTLIQELRTAID